MVMDDHSDGHKDVKQEQPQRLGFKEIVPGRDDMDTHETGGPTPVEIPAFDLGRQMMAQHRKVIATRRKGPAKQSQTPASCNPPVTSYPVKSPRNWAVYATKEQMDIIADIVARDIERLRSGESVFV